VLSMTLAVDAQPHHVRDPAAGCINVQAFAVSRSVSIAALMQWQCIANLWA
jgi:hypothetical protein